MIIYYTLLVLLKNILYNRAKDENNSFLNMSTPETCWLNSKNEFLVKSPHFLIPAMPQFDGAERLAAQLHRQLASPAPVSNWYIYQCEAPVR